MEKINPGLPESINSLKTQDNVTKDNENIK